TDKLSEFRVEAERLGVKVESPSVNRSGVDFEVEGSTIHYALAALKGVGRQAVETIVQARGGRRFADLSDFAASINPRAVNRRMRVESWAEFARAVRAGASAGRVAGTVVARTERRTRTGSKMGIIELSDPTGHYEAVVFSEGLAQFRDLLEPGAAVLLTLSAEL